MKRILIIDQNNEFIKNYCANPTISNNGLHVGALIGSIKCLQKYIREMKPTDVFICWDGEGGSRRKKQLNKNYKDGRKPPKLNRFIENGTEEQQKENKFWQAIRLCEYYEDLPVHQLMYEGVEGDDLISYVRSLFPNDQAIIVSSDKDFFQLLNDKTLIYRSVQKEIVNGKSVAKRYGIHTNNFALARSICGDESDNLKGVEGVGLKTVAKRFPFMKFETGYLITDIEKYCNEQIGKDSKIKAYSDIKNNMTLIKENYNIMQLVMPSISIQDKDKIKREIENKELVFRQTNFHMKLLKDHINIDFSLETLYDWCRIRVKNDV